MRLVLQQEERELLQAIQTLCKAENVTMEVVAERMNVTYQKLYQKLIGKMVSVEFIDEIILAVQGDRRGRRVQLVNYSEITIVGTSGMRIKLIGDE